MAGRTFFIPAWRLGTEGQERAKYKNIVHDPRMSLCINDAEHFTTVIASSTARFTAEHLWVDTRKIGERYRGPEQAAAAINRQLPSDLLAFSCQPLLQEFQSRY